MSKPERASKRAIGTGKDGERARERQREREKLVRDRAMGAG